MVVYPQQVGRTMHSRKSNMLLAVVCSNMRHLVSTHLLQAPATPALHGQTGCIQPRSPSYYTFGMNKWGEWFTAFMASCLLALSGVRLCGFPVFPFLQRCLGNGALGG